MSTPLRAQRDEVWARMKAIADAAVREDRNLTPTEQAELDDLNKRLDAIDAEARQSHPTDAARALYSPDAGGSSYAQQLRYGLAPEELRAHYEAITRGEAYASREERAMVTNATFGSASGWSSLSPQQATTLRGFAGVTTRPLEGATASHPVLTLPAVAVGVTETQQATEYSAVTANTVTVLRYGRWTNASALVHSFDDMMALNRAHHLAIGRDLNSADIGALEVIAGTATAYSSTSFDTDYRSTVMTVAETQGVGPDQLVVVGQPAALAKVTGYAPTDADQRGSVTLRSYGARIFPLASASANKLTIFAPTAFLAHEGGIGSATTIDPTTGASTFGTWVHSAAISAAITGGAKAIATA